MPTHSFSSITFETLEAVAGVQEVRADERFTRLLDAQCPPEWLEQSKPIIHRSDLNVDAYTEEEVKLRIIAPILQIVNFPETGCEEWWERPLEAEFGEVTIGGKVDFLLARGKKAPETPYFFLNEFKPSFSEKNPEVQLAAELAAALQISPDRDEVLGAYVAGQIWRFVSMQRERVKFPSYTYAVSETLDSMRLHGMQKILAALHTLKSDITQALQPS